MFLLVVCLIWTGQLWQNCGCAGGMGLDVGNDWCAVKSGGHRALGECAGCVSQSSLRVWDRSGWVGSLDGWYNRDLLVGS